MHQLTVERARFLAAPDQAGVVKKYNSAAFGADNLHSADIKIFKSQRLAEDVSGMQIFQDRLSSVRVNPDQIRLPSCRIPIF